jgi:hypothetical protein
LIFCDRDLQLRGAGPYSGSGAAYLLRNFGQTKARKSELPESRILGLCPKVLPHFAFAFNPISIVCSQHPRQIFFSFASSFAFSTASPSTIDTWSRDVLDAAAFCLAAAGFAAEGGVALS